MEEQGFKYKKRTKGGYEKFHHPDGSRIYIRPNGEIVRTGKKVISKEGRKYAPRISPGGKRTESHSTGEKILLEREN